MRGLLVVVALFFTLLASPASAVSNDGFAVTAWDDGYLFGFYFDEKSVSSARGLNPTVTVSSGTNLTVSFFNNGTVAHNFFLGAPIDDGVPCCVNSGAQANFSFVAPSSLTPGSTIPYWCVPHRDLGMRGTFTIAGANDSNANGTRNENVSTNSSMGGGVGNPRQIGGFGAAFTIAASTLAIFAARRRS